MIKTLARYLLCAFVLLPGAAAAEPIRLKLSLISSDQALIYLGAVKPFVDAVNAEAKGILEIEVFFSGAMSKVLAHQSQLVLDDVADMAFIFPSYTPDRFNDNTVVELPGLFNGLREASLVYTRLIVTGALKGYEDFFVISAICSPLQNIHSRLPITSLADLKGKYIRTNNLTESAAVEKLGMYPVVMPINQIAEAIISGKIDSATVPPAMLFEFGIGRITSNHFLLDISSAPLALVMNRKKFESLPKQAQDIIRKYSGEWPIARYVEIYGGVNDRVREELIANPRRKVIFPSRADLDAAQLAFKSVIAEWAAKSPRNREQLKAAEAEIAKLRATR